MITKGDWDAVHEELAEERRRELGDPPTLEESRAFLEGKLPPEEEARVRELLIWHPDLARTLVEPFPDERARPGEAGFVSEVELARRWKSLQKKIRRSDAPEPRSLELWRASAALAAMLAIVFGALLWRAESESDRLRRELSEPRIVSDRRDLGAATRGAGAAAADAGGDMVLVAPHFDHPGYERYRVEMAGGDPPRTLWSETARLSGYRFSIVVPREFLKPGRYHVTVYGIDRAGERKLESYDIDIEQSAAGGGMN